jgi:hypothetical protein
LLLQNIPTAPLQHGNVSYLWKCYSAVYSALGYFLYSAFGFFPRIVPSLVRVFLSTREKPDDIEGSEGLLFRNQPPTIAKDSSLGSGPVIEDQATIPVEKKKIQFSMNLL